MLLRPVADSDRDDDETPTGATADNSVALAVEPAARAVARFVARRSDLVLGGTFADWPVVAAAGPAPANLRIDPAAGLFGLAIARREGLLADPLGRAAVAAAIDRTAIVGSFPAGTVATETILPERLDSAASPIQPAWSALPQPDRQAEARRVVAAYRARTGAPVALTIALLPGPGSALLFRRLAFALSRVDIALARAMSDDTADLRLIDRVAPYDSARWYLRTACAPCGEEAEAAIEAARLAPTSDERARAIALADVALDRDVAFIPLLRPVRWSLVALRLTRFQGNPRAWHPLDHLREPSD